MCDIPPASHPVFSFFSLHTPNSMHIIPPLECLPKTWTCQPLCAAVDGSFGCWAVVSPTVHCRLYKHFVMLVCSLIREELLAIRCQLASPISNFKPFSVVSLFFLFVPIRLSLSFLIGKGNEMLIYKNYGLRF